MAKFKQKYKKKIWYMNPHFKGSDFFCLVGEFKDTHVAIYMKVGARNNLEEFQEEIGYFENGKFHKVEGIKNGEDVANSVLQDIIGGLK